MCIYGRGYEQLTVGEGGPRVLALSFNFLLDSGIVNC